MKRLILTLGTFLLLVQSLAALDLNKEMVLQKLFNAYGGTANIKKTTHLVQKGEGFSTMKNATGTILRIYSYPLNLRMEKRFSDSDGEIRILDKNKGWRDGKAVSGILLTSMQLQAARIMLPKLLMDNPEKISYNGLYTDLQGKQWHLLTYALAPSATLYIQVDTADYLVKATTGTLSQAGQQMQFITTYSDFKPFGGLLFATQEKHYAMNRLVGWTKLSSVQNVTQHTPTAFRP